MFKWAFHFLSFIYFGVALQWTYTRMGENKVDNALKILSRIRCLNECALSLKDGTAFPPALYYTSAETECRTAATIDIPIYQQTKAETCYKLFRCTPTHRLHLKGIYEYNSDGVWDKLIKITLNKTVVLRSDGTDQWILLCSFKMTSQTFLVPVNDWKCFVDQSYLPKGVMNSKRCQFQASSDGLNLERFRQDLCSWTASHDEQLCDFLLSRSPKTSRDYVESFKAEGIQGVQEIFNDDWTEAWMSLNGPQHTIDFCLKKGVILESLTLYLLTGFFMTEPDDPAEVEVLGGESGNLRVLRTMVIDYEHARIFEILPRQLSYLECIRIVLKPRIYHEAVWIGGIEIKPIQNFYEAHNFYMTSDMSRYPMLQRFPPEMLYIRSVLFKRLVELFDSVFPYLFPKWEHTLGFTDLKQSLQVILPLSSKRVPLIVEMIDKTQLYLKPPSLLIDRTVQNSLNATDRNFKNSVFYQIFNELKHFDKDCMHYRFAKDLEQWWACEFIGKDTSEGSGGFRDSLSNISEELCPNLESGQVPILNLFIPSPNQRNVTIHDLRDTFIPNPSCSEFQYYEWIGKLMGGALRTNDNLVLCLPKYFWKMLVGAQLSWKDYASVDEKEVNVMNSMENMDEESFESYFVGTRMWTTILSDGTVVPLKPDGEKLVVEYCDRLEYAKLAQVARMNEFKTQVDAIRAGLLQAVPDSVLQLLTLKEIEERICGKSEISIADLEKCISFTVGAGNDEQRRKYFWATLEKFTNEDRSRFLRFITGRHRLPVKIYVRNKEGIDICPSADTNSYVFHLPDYSSAEVAEHKIRYAIYNCATIDTD